MTTGTVAGLAARRATAITLGALLLAGVGTAAGLHLQAVRDQGRECEHAGVLAHRAASQEKAGLDAAGCPLTVDVRDDPEILVHASLVTAAIGTTGGTRGSRSGREAGVGRS